MSFSVNDRYISISRSQSKNDGVSFDVEEFPEHDHVDPEIIDRIKSIASKKHVDCSPNSSASTSAAAPASVIGQLCQCYTHIRVLDF